MSEIQDAVQIIKVGYDGIEIVMKVGSTGFDGMKKAIDFLISILEREKQLGETSMRKILEKGGDLQIFQFNTEDMKQVKKIAKSYGVLYSVLPDINKQDGMSEIMFHSEAVPRINMMIQKFKVGRIATFDDYLKNGDEKEMEKVLKFLKEQKQENEQSHTEESTRVKVIMEGLIEKVGLFATEKKTISVEAIKENFGVGGKQAEDILNQLQTIGLLKISEKGEWSVVMDKDAFEKRLNKYQELRERLKAISASKNMNLVDITIAKKLIVDETDQEMKVRIPYEQEKFIWIPKDTTMEVHNGKTVLTFIDKDKDIKIYTKDNQVVETSKGAMLYEKHFDPVSAKAREYANKPQKNPTRNTVEKTR